MPRTRPSTLLLSIALLLAPAAPVLAREVHYSQIVETPGGPSEIQHFTRTVVDEPAQRFAGVGAAMTAETLGAQRTLVSLVNFTNDPTTPFVAADVDFDLLDAANPTSTASYVLEASYDRAWLTGSVDDWVSAGYDDSSCTVAQPDGTQDLIDALDSGIDFSLVDRWIILIPNNSACGFAGISSLGKWDFDSDEGPVRFSRVVVNGPRSTLSALIAHELGHSFVGLQHSTDHECGLATVGPGCVEVSSDVYDVMGDVAGFGHYTPPGKEALGWFDGDVTDVPAPGGTYLIEPYETVGTGTRALRIPVPWYLDDYSENHHYYVSYRTPQGFDANLPGLAADGAMLHLDAHYFPTFSMDATAASRLLDASPHTTAQGSDSIDVLLEVGEIFVDATHGITVETLGVVGGSLEVAVTIDQYCGNGVRDAAIGEQCDTSDLAGNSCASLGFTSGALACTASCTWDLTACGAAQCGAGDSFDDGAQLCTASLLSVAPPDMNLYKNAATWSDARNAPAATLLTVGRGFFAAVQNVFTSNRSILYRMILPFDTSVLPPGAVIESATLELKLDSYPVIVDTHPGTADQLVLVQTNDPTPTVRDLTDFAAFVPIDAPNEGAARVDVSALADFTSFSMPLNATGLSWIDETGITKLGLRSGFDVDDVSYLPPEQLDMRLGIVPTTSPIAGPRLVVSYQPLPEPGGALGLACGAVLLARLGRRRRGDR